MRYTTAASVFAFAAVALVPTSALAQSDSEDVELRDAEAQRWFQAGRMAFSDGRFEDALDAFRKAYSLSERPELLFNVASAADRLRRDEEALDAFKAYLRERPDAPNRDEVEGRIRELRRIVEEREATDAEREAPTPEETASTAVEPSTESASTSAAAETPEEEEGSSPWLWVGIGGGAAVVAAVVVGVAVAMSGGGGDNESLIRGDVGEVIFTLGDR